MKTRWKIKKIVGAAILSAIAVVLQLIANYITIGQLSINLSLIPIVIAAIIYGPFSGALVGSLVGVVILLAPSTSVFLGYNAFATVVLCILKTGLAGLVSGLLFMLIKKLSFVGATITSTLIVPIINTGLFLIGVLLWFLPVYGSNTDESIKNLITTLFLINFAVEFAINAVLSPTIVYLVRLLDKRFNLEINK